MNGEAHWLPLLVWFVGLAVVIVLAWASLGAWSRFVRRRVTVTCPKSGDSVDCVFKGDTSRDGMFVDVERCTAFEDPDHVTCDKACLHTIHAKRA